MSIAKSIFGKLMKIWKATEISLKQKLRLYNAAVISIVSFGFETWEMPQKLEDSLRSWNARFLAAITGREIPQEHRQPTFDLIAKLGARRMKGAGQILRLEPADSLVHQLQVFQGGCRYAWSGCRQQQAVPTDGCRRVHNIRGTVSTGSRQDGLGRESQID